MKVKLAKTAGVCMGVRRALDMVLTEANKDHGPLYTYGPLIHNEQVMKLLESKGVSPMDVIPHIQKGTIVIRAHGIPPEQRKLLKASGLTIIDATCPRVARVQSIVRYHTHKGSTALIVGEADHPEVIGLKGYGNGKAHVISSIEELPDRILLYTADGESALDQVHARGIPVESALVRRSTLEDVFLRLTGRSLIE